MGIFARFRIARDHMIGLQAVPFRTPPCAYKGGPVPSYSSSNHYEYTVFPYSSILALTEAGVFVFTYVPSYDPLILCLSSRSAIGMCYSGF